MSRATPHFVVTSTTLSLKTIRKTNAALHSLLRTAHKKIARQSLAAASALLLALTIAPLTAWAGSPAPTVTTFTLQPNTTSTTQSATVQIAAGGTLTAISVVTQGATGLDFTPNNQPGDSCVLNQQYNNNTSCTVSVQFEPRTPGSHFGAVVLTFTSGSSTTTAVQYLYGSNQGPLGVITPGLINTVAGSSNSIYIPGSDGIPAVFAPIKLPLGVFVDATGNFYISDWGNRRIRKVSAAATPTVPAGTISTYAGGGSIGVITPGLAATTASIDEPSGIAMDGAGNLYFADSTASLIYMVDPNTGFISIVAGTQEVAGFKDGPVLQAELSGPNGLAIDANENLYIADTGNNLIRKIDLKVDPADRQIVTIAGTLTGGFGGDGSPAASAVFNQPWGLAIGPDGLLYIADSNNNVIRRIDPVGTGLTATVVGMHAPGAFGGDGGPANQANLQLPDGVVVDLAGNIYVADTQNNAIRKATVQPMQPGGGYTISTIAGNPTNATFFGDTGPSTAATMSSPSSLALDSAGNLYFGDLFDNRIRIISTQPPLLNYGQIKNFRTSPAKTETFENDGNAGMTIGQITLVNAALDGTTTCLTNGTLAPSISCILGVEFAPEVQNLPADPTEQGIPTPGSVTIASNAANSPGTISLTGAVLNVNPTTTTLTSSANPSATGANVTFTATVSNGGGSNGAVTGTVAFMDGATTLAASQPLNSTGVATFSTTSLTLGTHTITAVYSDDTNNAPSTSLPLTQIVKTGTTLAVTSNSLPNATFPQTIIFTATLSGATAPIGGTISFSDGSTLLGAPVTPSAAGVASLSVVALGPPGQHTINATFAGDSNNLTSTASLTQNVLPTPTSTTLGTGNPSPTFGTPVSLTATVASTGTPPATSPLTGTVTFTDTTTNIVLGTPPLANGIASLSVSGLAPGPHFITATYSGDTDNASSTTTSTQSETVAQIVSAVMVTSASPQANAGTPVSFTAKVSIPSNTTAGGPLSGTITFFDNGTQIGQSGPLTPNGNTLTATFTALTFTPGPHQITATYSGAANYSGATSTPFALTVNINNSTTNLSTTTPNPSIAGQPINLSATVSGQAGASTPTKTVTFTAVMTGVNTITLGQIPLNAGGTAILPPVASLPPGTWQITAAYSGDTDNNPSSATITQTIKSAATALTLVSSTNATQVGNKVTFTASLGAINDQPTGTVTFFDNGTAIGPVNLPATGGTIVTFSTTSLSAGPHTITASYNGDTDDSAATATGVTVQIQQLPTTATLVSNSTPGTFSQPVTLTATVTSNNVVPTGTVQFLDGATVIGTPSLITNGASFSGTATLTVSNLSLGNHAITANYLGDTNHLVTSATLSQQILATPGVNVISSNASSIAGQNIQLTANVTGIQNIVPTGTITFRDGGSVLNVVPVSPAAGTAAATGVATLNTLSLAPGTHNIVASYSGDTDYQVASSPALSQTVTIANTTVSLVSGANPATFNTPLTLTASVTGTGTSVSGTVTFMDGGTVIGKIVLNNTGVATLTTSALAPGQHTITAVYSGDTNNQPNTSSAIQELVEQSTVTTIVSSANPALTLAPIVLTCTVSNSGTQHATGTVTFTDGSTLLGTAALDGNSQATLSLPSLAAGQHNIVASYSGDAVDFPSTSAIFPQAVQLRPTTDVLTATTTSLTDGKQLTLISVIRWTGPNTPTGTVNFTIGNTVVGTTTVDSVGVATLTIILDPGSATVVSSYSGDSVYAPSSSPATAVTDGPPTSFTLQLSNANITLQSKQNTTVNLNITSLNGFSDTLTLGCLGLPYAASCTFSTTQTSVPANGTQTVRLVIDTAAPLLAGTNVNTSGLSGGSKRIILFALLASLLPGLLLLRSRKRHPLAGLLIVLYSIVLATGLSGCGALNINGTPAGTYTFKVTASGTNTGITQTTNVTLTVQ